MSLFLVRLRSINKTQTLPLRISKIRRLSMHQTMIDYRHLRSENNLFIYNFFHQKKTLNTEGHIFRTKESLKALYAIDHSQIHYGQNRS
jgi:hypothetical protein